MAKLTIKKPSLSTTPPGMKVAAFAGVGLVVGMSWPWLAGVRIGPAVPGAEAATKASASAAASARAPKTTPKRKKGSGPIRLAADKPASAHDNTQKVVVGKGVVRRCYDGKKKVDACGALKVDRLFVPHLRQLNTCPSALGLAGEMEIGFDLRFKAKEVSVTKGSKSDLPTTTVNGIIRCAADFIKNVSAENIPHTHSRYHVIYSLKFYPPGSGPAKEGKEGEATADENASSMGQVNWDVALVRAEPKTGKVIARLVRGTRIELLGRRKDWYRVKVKGKEGWIYRGALTL